MSTIFINSKNSKKSDSHRLLLNLLDKMNLEREREKGEICCFSNS